MNRRAGLSLIEVLIGLVILTLVMTTSLGIFYERQRRLQRAEQTVIAWQALANEAEMQRHVPYGNLVPGSESAFLSDDTLVGELPGALTKVAVRQTKPDFKTVTLTLRWNDGLRRADLGIVRADTGGSPLW